MRTEWCYVAESRGRAIGRAAFWTLPKMSRPLDVVLLDVPWETEGAYEIGVNLLQEVFCIARLFGVDELGHVMDSPGQWPQWQFHEGERAALLESQGFRVDRVMHRFEFHTGEAKLPPFDERELLFRSLIEVAEEAFKAALIRVSEGFVITGYPDSEILDRILQVSPVTVLKKPLKIEQLNQTLNILGHKTPKLES